MCIIIVAKSGLKVPMEHFVTSWSINSDGAGICYNEGGMVHIKKGFMTFDAFKEALQEIPISSDRVFHFRIATSGKIVPGVTHPYPVEPNYKAMYSTDVYTSMACAHNGIIHWCTPQNGLKDSFSDSMAFIAGYVYPLKDRVMSNHALQELIARATGSKFAFMDGSSVITVGDFIEVNGIFYSNSTYKTYTLYRPSIGYECAYGDSYGDDYGGYDGLGYYKTYNTRKSINICEKSTVVPETVTAVHAEEVFNEDDFEKMKIDALESGAEDPVIICFKSQDGIVGLNEGDAEYILDFLINDLDVNILTFDYDSVNGVMYVTTEWNHVIIIPNIIGIASWSVIA